MAPKQPQSENEVRLAAQNIVIGRERDSLRAELEGFRRHPIVDAAAKAAIQMAGGICGRYSSIVEVDGRVLHVVVQTHEMSTRIEEAHRREILEAFNDGVVWQSSPEEKLSTREAAELIEGEYDDVIDELRVLLAAEVTT